MSIGPDPITGAQTVIEEDHRIIHDGRAFTSAYPEVLKKNEELNFVIRTPQDVSPHLRSWRFWVQRNKEVHFRLFEGATVFGGMPWPAHNNRRGGPPPETIIRINPTVTDYGAVIDYAVVNYQCPEYTLGSEWILNPDSAYIMQLRNEGSKCDVAVRAFWYEPGPYFSASSI